MKRVDARPTCSTWCQAYVAGEPGTRYCKDGHWDERASGRLPLVRRKDFKVLTPWTCSVRGLV